MSKEHSCDIKQILKMDFYSDSTAPDICLRRYPVGSPPQKVSEPKAPGQKAS